MNPHASQPLSPASMVRSIWRHRGLAFQMVKHEVTGRYKGSVLGLLWSFLNPIFMLTVYTFFFAVVFKARWGGTSGPESKAQFALILFVGMIVHSLFSEILNRAPTLILANTNFVKKVVFPLEILSVISIGSALFHALTSLCVLLVFYLVFNGLPHWQVVFLPLIWGPMLILALGLGWLLAALGVYMRDLAQTMGLVTTVLLFLSPVFYAVKALPENLQPFIFANPLTFIIEQSRAVIINGQLPDFAGLALYTLIALVVASLGYAWFQSTRKGFADVL